MASKWLEWKPILDTFGTPGIRENPIVHVHPSETPEAQHIRTNPIIHDSGGRNNDCEPRSIEKTHIPPVPKVAEIPPIPKGVRLICWDPKQSLVAIEVCSVVVDIPKFIERELRALDSRLNNPSTIHGGFSVAQMLNRLAQAGVEVELELRGGASTTKFQNTEGGDEIK
jgi:hypothetical protein